MAENKSLEDLLAETEQKIMNNSFNKQFTLTYDGEDYDFILKPLSQNDFLNIYQRNQNNIAKLNEAIINKCLITDEGKPYPKELVRVLIDKMPAGFASDVTKRVYEISGIQTNPEDLEQAKSFLNNTSKL